MVEDLEDIVLNKSPKDFGYLSATWDTHMISEYAANTHNKERYVQDETKIRVEYNNYWSGIPIGWTPIIEGNGA